MWIFIMEREPFRTLYWIRRYVSVGRVCLCLTLSAPLSSLFHLSRSLSVYSKSVSLHTVVVSLISRCKAFVIFRHANQRVREQCNDFVKSPINRARSTVSVTTANSNSRNSNIIRNRIKEILQANIFKIGSMTSQIGRHNNCRTIMSKSQRHSKIYLIRKKTFHRKYKYYETVTITTDKIFSKS